MQQQVINNLRRSLWNPYSFHLVSHFEECSLGVIVNSRIFFWECHGTFLISYFNHWSFLLNFHHPGTKESSATHTKDSCEKNVPKLPEFMECYFRNCSLCVTVNSVKCLVLHSPGMFTLCYCELWVHSFENLKHFLFEVLVVLGDECYGTFSNKPFASRLQSFSKPVFWTSVDNAFGSWWRFIKCVTHILS